MTDLIPNDLSHLSDKDFNALCPQGHHAPGAEPLSPAAQAVLDAYESSWDGHYVDGEWVPDHGAQLAAALRSAADQVVPENHVYNETSDGTMRRVNELWVIRRGLYAIATELEGQ